MGKFDVIKKWFSKGFARGYSECMTKIVAELILNEIDLKSVHDAIEFLGKYRETREKNDIQAWIELFEKNKEWLQ
jgi:hypothetical protein